MSLSLVRPEATELKPRIVVFGVGGAGGNAVNNMIESGLLGCEFVVANTDAQALTSSKAERVIQMGLGVTQGLGAGSHPEVGSAATGAITGKLSEDDSTTAPARPTSLGARRRTVFFTVTNSPSTSPAGRGIHRRPALVILT